MADVRGRDSLSPSRETCKNKTMLYSCESQDVKKKTVQMDAKQQCPQTLLLRWPSIKQTQAYLCVKTTHLSKESSHQDHMVEVHIRSWGCSTRLSWQYAHPPVHWGISCATWAYSWQGTYCRWEFFFSLQRPTSERRRPDTFGVSTVLLCNHAIKKVLMTEHYEVFFLLLRLSAR